MKKVFTTIFLCFVITINLFAGEYYYWEKEGKTSSGRTSVHARICCTKNYLDNKTANKYLNDTMETFTNDFGQWIQGYEVTDVYFKNGFMYRIVFTWDYKSSAGKIFIAGGLADRTLKEIYDSGYCYESYKTLLDFYNKKCNEYLCMI